MNHIFQHVTTFTVIPSTKSEKIQNSPVDTERTDPQQVTRGESTDNNMRDGDQTTVSSPTILTAPATPTADVHPHTHSERSRKNKHRVKQND